MWGRVALVWLRRSDGTELRLIVCPHAQHCTPLSGVYKDGNGKLWRFCYKPEGVKKQPEGCINMMGERLYNMIMENFEELYTQSKDLLRKDAQAAEAARAKSAPPASRR